MDYYDILGVARGASADEIKKAFRKRRINYTLTKIREMKRNLKR